MKAQSFIGTLVLSLVAAAMVVGTALAEPEYRAGTRLSEQARSDAQRLQVVVPVPEVSERLGQGGMGAGELSASTLSVPVPEVSERPGQGGVSLSAVASSASDDGFGWGAAMVGAASAFGLILIGGTAALAIRQRGRMISH